MSQVELELDKSHRWSLRQEFGQRVLRGKRKALGLTQREVAEKIGIHQSRISRIEDGGRTDDPVLAEKISQVYLLDKSEAELWLHYCFGTPTSNAEDITNISISCLESTRSPAPLLEAYSSHANIAFSVRFSGNPRLTVQIVDTVAEQIAEVIRADTYPKERPAMLTILADLYIEQGWALSEISSRHAVWAHKSGFVNRLERIAKQHNDASFSILACRFLGDAYYVAGKHDMAIRYLLRSLRLEHNPKHQMEDSLTLAKIWALRQDESRFQERRSEITRIIDQGHITALRDISLIYSNFARSEARIAPQYAFKSLEVAKDAIAKMQIEQRRSPLCEAQVVRDELEVCKLIDPNGQHSYLESRGKEALHLAKQSGYFRVANRIEQLLSEILG